MFGFLNIDKPAGITSRDVVNAIQRLVKPHKVGHAGTLDPLATGVLVVAVGPATRLVDYVHRYGKGYVGQFRLGLTSDTEDISGQVSPVPLPNISGEMLQDVLPRFQGEISQIPPAYSAIHVDGKRSYDLARAGKAVELPPRQITIHQLSLGDFAFPNFTLEIACSTGTYVRTLGRDIARALGTDAVMTALRRTYVGLFAVASAIPLAEVSSAEVVRRKLLPALLAVQELPRLEATGYMADWLRQGKKLPAPSHLSGEVVASAAGELIAIGEVSGGLFHPRSVFPPA